MRACLHWSHCVLCLWRGLWVNCWSCICAIEKPTYDVGPKCNSGYRQVNRRRMFVFNLRSEDAHLAHTISNNFPIVSPARSASKDVSRCCLCTKTVQRPGTSSQNKHCFWLCISFTYRIRTGCTHAWNSECDCFQTDWDEQQYWLEAVLWTRPVFAFVFFAIYRAKQRDTDGHIKGN